MMLMSPRDVVCPMFQGASANPVRRLERGPQFTFTRPPGLNTGPLCEARISPLMVLTFMFLNVLTKCPCPVFRRRASISRESGGYKRGSIFFEYLRMTASQKAAAIRDFSA